MNKFKLSQLLSALLLAIAGSQVSAAIFTGGNNISTNVSDINSNAVAIGDSSTRVNDRSSVAIGGSARTSGADSVAIGGATTIGIYDAPYGGAPTTSVSGGVAVGRSASIESDLGLALGFSAKVKSSASGGMALGANSVADRAGFATDAVTFNGEVLDLNSGAAWVSSYGAASIGTATQTRQLMGVAAGSADTDAVNVAQLRSLKAYSDATFSTASNTIFGEGASNVIKPAVTGDDGSITEQAQLAENAAVFGNNAKVLVHNGVAVGAGSVASTVGRNATSPYVAGGATVETSNGGAWASEGLVSFGYTETVPAPEGGEATYVTHNRTLTGVAAGSEDNDAVNVAQLKEVNNQVQGLVQGTTQISQIDLLADPSNPDAGGIGLRFEAGTPASGTPTARAAGDEIGRLAYDADGTSYKVATTRDGFTLSGGNTGTTAPDGSTVAPVKVDLEQGISFLGEDNGYITTTVTQGTDGTGAIVKIGLTPEANQFLLNNIGQPSEPSNPSNPGSGTGGTWTPNAAQQAALNGTYANGLTAGEGNNAVSIAREKDADGRYIVDMGGNRVQNVGNPINDGDAANKAYVDSTSRSLRNKINDVDKDLRAGVAMAMAVGGLPQAYMPGKSIVGVSAGTYHGQGGFALGLSHATDNRQWVFKGAASVDTRGNFGGQLSAGYQF